MQAYVSLTRQNLSTISRSIAHLALSTQMKTADARRLVRGNVALTNQNICREPRRIRLISALVKSTLLSSLCPPKSELSSTTFRVASEIA